jgi:hypothetical protein
MYVNEWLDYYFIELAGGKLENVRGQYAPFVAAQK